jgi:pyruvate/2-oxoglutarate dehydrogenase complex dihydrolipoamide acyltransferase (E2) component
VLTVESVKCRICGARHAADAAVCPTCGTKVRRSSSSRKASAAKPKPQPYGLEPQALLAKIDSLDWEDPTIQPQAASAATANEPPPTKRTLLFPFVAGFIVLLVGMIALRYFSTDRTVPSTPVVVAEAPSEPTPTAVPTPTPAPAEPTDQAPASQQPTSLATAEEAEKVKLEEARRHRAELRRKALAAKQALAEKNRLERVEQERMRAEQAAAEARAKAAAAAATATPKGPSSPQEVCAGEENAFAVSACEARTCAQAQWRSHPFCIKRWQNELRKLSPSSFGG